MDREQALEAIVAVDHAAVEIVEIRRCVAASFERDHRTQCRRYHRKSCEEHPFRTDVGALERFGKAKALAKLVAISGTGLFVVLADFLDECVEIDRFQQRVKRFGTDSGAEHCSVLHGEEVVCSFIEHDAFLDRFDLLLGFGRLLFELGLYLCRCSRLGLLSEFEFEVFQQSRTLLFVDRSHDVAGEVHHLFHFCGRKSKHQRDARRDTAEEPDVCDRGREVDVAHALAAHDGTSDLHAALFTDDPSEADTAVFTAVTLVILFRTEYALVEKTVLLGALGAVVDGLRLCDLTV